MALTQAHLDTLVEAWAAGSLRATYADGTEIQFASRADLEARISRTAAALGVTSPLAAASATKRIRRILLNSSKGVD